MQMLEESLLLTKEQNEKRLKLNELHKAEFDPEAGKQALEEEADAVYEGNRHERRKAAALERKERV